MARTTQIRRTKKAQRDQIADRPTPSEDQPAKRRRLSPPEDLQNNGESEATIKQQPRSKPAKSTESKLTTQPTTTASSAPPSRIQTTPLDLPPLKGLDSSEPHIRRATFKTILEHLYTRPITSPLTKTQSLQLWRGFFVATYMHDSKSAISVQNLLQDIAGTFETISGKDEKLRSQDIEEAEGPRKGWLRVYHEALWETLVREWAGIDSWRMNKYLLLVRFVVRQLAAICLGGMFDGADEQKGTKELMEKRKAGALRRTGEVLEVLTDVGPLNPKKQRIPDGLRLHVLDLWADEVFGALKEGQDASSDTDEESSFRDRAVEVLNAMKQPIAEMAKSDSGAQKHVRMRAKEAFEAFEEKQKDWK